jgi:hypothetical protein
MASAAKQPAVYSPSEPQDERRSSDLAARCAWCERVLASGQWLVDRRDTRASVIHDDTHSICPDCVTKLRTQGLSH